MINSVTNMKQLKITLKNRSDAKLKQVTEFEAKYGESTRTKAWKKWCTNTKYRQNEWQFRQNIANSIKPNVKYV